MKTYGSMTLRDGHWVIRCAPQVAIRLKHTLSYVKKEAVGELTVSHTPEHCRDLQWFADRFPMEISPLAALNASAQRHLDHVASIQDLIGGHLPPTSCDLAKPARDYQKQVVALARHTGHLLLGDDLGLGKTVSGIATIAAPEYLPAVIVVPANLLDQWAAQLALFVPHLRVFTTPGIRPFAFPQFLGTGPDIILTSYRRLEPWFELIAAYVKSVIFDEVHELRCTGSQKYSAAQRLSTTETVRLRMGLSATPIYNYGVEFHSICSVLAPGFLGTLDEFCREWCDYDYDEKKARIRDPEAFGCYLRESGLLLRRTRADVGRELPPVISVTHPVTVNAKPFDDISAEVKVLAETLLQGANLPKAAKMQAARELTWKMRQATGISKAPAVATLVKMLVESGERVLLAGYHHAVYDIWQDALRKAGVRVAKYTGKESLPGKRAAFDAWEKGEIDVLCISLRTGAGLDGLEKMGSVVVFGELDWSWAAILQLIGRLHRDGQTKQVVSYFCTSESGTDPFMSEVLGLKRVQLEGVIQRAGDVAMVQRSDGRHIRSLAKRVLGMAETPDETIHSEDLTAEEVADIFAAAS